MIAPLCTLFCLAGVDASAQRLHVELDPPEHEVRVVSTIHVEGAGRLDLRLSDLAESVEVMLDGAPTEFKRSAKPETGEPGVITMFLPDAKPHEVVMTYSAHFEQDIAVGEVPGQVHNFTMNAHIGEQGVFLSEGSAWHPQPLDDCGRALPHTISVDIEPREGWACVVSGDPAGVGDLASPCWRWTTPRPLDGVALVGNRHVLLGVVHETPHGPVEIVMHFPLEHEKLAPMFLEAAERYLDLYTPRLGRFPYKRFSIVENFFSSGFAYPGFTLLGPRVVAMAPRSLMPGFLDHEMIHNWWGNGVYLDPDAGNWCEALTTYCANYYRRILDEGPEAGRAYRRTTLMKLSADPDALDDGALAAFGSADPAIGGASRFVGYDKGAFVLAMLEDILTETAGKDAAWRALKQFADENMGRRANWRDIQAAYEAQCPDQPAGWLDPFFQRWVYEHTVPVTPTKADEETLACFVVQYAANDATEPPTIVSRFEDEEGSWIEVDPEFRCYRILPPQQIIPLIGGTMGGAGYAIESNEARDEVAAFTGAFPGSESGESLFLIGAEAIRARAALLARSADPISVSEDGASFTVGGETYDEPNQSVMHTMQHPDKPGGFITAFHSNGAPGWSRLRLIIHYRRDTTVIWQDDEVLSRRTFEPDRRIRLEKSGRSAFSGSASSYDGNAFGEKAGRPPLFRAQKTPRTSGSGA